MLRRRAGWWIETTGFQQSDEQAFASLPLGLEFGLSSGECELWKMQFEGFKDAHQNRSSMSTT